LYKKFSMAEVNFLSLNFSSFITWWVLSSFATARPFKLLIKLWVLSDNSYASNKWVKKLCCVACWAMWFYAAVII
jgi:hypothetical protein